MVITARLASVGVFLLALAAWHQPAKVEAGQVRFQVPSPQAPGRFEDASRHYGEALEGNPAWAPAQSRFNALRARAATP